MTRKKPDRIVCGGRECRIVWSPKRKTLCLRIGKDGVPEFLLPAGLPADELNAFAARYDNWVREKAEAWQAKREEWDDFSFAYGAKVDFLGGKREIRAWEGNRIGFNGEAFLVPAGLDAEELRDACEQIYRLAAKNLLPPLIEKRAREMGLSPTGFKVNGAKTRWASCSNRNSLNFSWTTMLAPPEAVDYVIVHELCHMWEFSHSERFWRLVGTWCPSYAAQRETLKKLSRGVVPKYYR